jgi:hypothetical protein
MWGKNDVRSGGCAMVSCWFESEIGRENLILVLHNS